MSEKDMEDLTVNISNDNLKKFGRFRDIAKKSKDPEVEYIAWYLKKKGRKTDKKQYLVTYRELEGILKRYDVLMQNPSNNSIDIMHWVQVERTRWTILSKRTTTPELRKVCSLGFPGWTKTVGQGRIKHLRSQLKLTDRDGVDSQSFFRDVDDMRGLIGMYENALRRLADR